MTGSPLYMAGTEGTGQYLVMCQTPLGRLGVRDLPGGSARVRVEPSTMEAAATLASSLTRPLGWKQPGDNDQSRFSRLVLPYGLQSVVRMGLIALGAHQSAEWNPNAPEWVREMVMGSGTSPQAIPTPVPEVEPTITLAFTPVVVEGNDPAALRSEASLLREEASQLRERARLDATKASELEARAVACILRAAEIERALATFMAAKSKVRQLGVSSPTSGGAKAGLSLLTKAQLMGLAEKLGIKVAKATKKSELVELIAEA